MKIACTTLACPSWPLETIVERFAEYGYDGLDFRGLGEQTEIWRLEEFSSKAAETAEKIAAGGLAVSGFSSSARMFHADPADEAKSLAEVRQYAALCRKFDCHMIRVFGGGLEGAPIGEAVETSVATLRKLAEAAGEGVTVAVETHDDWYRTAPLAEVFAKVDAPNVGVLWDMHHPFRMGGESPQQTFDSVGRYTVAVHIKDSVPTGDGKHAYCLPGEGDVPLAEMIRLLRGGGYDGFLTFEWEKRWHPELPEPEVALPAYVEFVRGIA